MTAKKIIFSAACLFLLQLFVLPVQVYAQANQNGTAAAKTSVAKLENPFGEGTTLTGLIGRITSIFIGISGSVALVMFVYGGFLWVTSSGSEEQVTKGKNIFTWSTIGLVIIFMAYAIVNQVFGLLR